MSHYAGSAHLMFDMRDACIEKVVVMQCVCSPASEHRCSFRSKAVPTLTADGKAAVKLIRTESHMPLRLAAPEGSGRARRVDYSKLSFANFKLALFGVCARAVCLLIRSIQMIIQDKVVLGCSLYTQRSKQSRLDVWPFALAYASLWLAAVAGEGVSSDKAGSKLFLLIATPVVLLMHLLVFLGCQWSISCRCTVGYKQCNDIDSAELVRVYPAPNCGLEELVPLQRRKRPTASTVTLAGQPF
eukprot:6007-Heterococcus_DN1.PRE.2